MIIKYPTYYKNFKCIADKCTDTCCVGWQVVIDDTTAEFYRSLKSEFGDKLRAKMVVDEDGDTVFVNEKGRCPFLNSCNLCEIYINTGEENLSHTCTMFPRFYETYGGTREMGLSLSCSVANDLILSDKDFAFEDEFNEEMPEFNDIDADLYMCLKAEREKLLNFAKTDLSMPEKLKAIYNYAQNLNELLVKENYKKIKELNFSKSDKDLEIDNSIFENLEYLTIQGENLIKDEKNYCNNYSEKYINLLIYFIYRYFLKSVYNSKTFESLLFAVFSLKVISALENSTGKSLSEVSGIYSKEIEHSAYNLNVILEFLSNKGINI